MGHQGNNKDHFPVSQILTASRLLLFTDPYGTKPIWYKIEHRNGGGQTYIHSPDEVHEEVEQTLCFVK